MIIDKEKNTSWILRQKEIIHKSLYEMLRSKK